MSTFSVQRKMNMSKITLVVTVSTSNNGSLVTTVTELQPEEEEKVLRAKSFKMSQMLVKTADL